MKNAAATIRFALQNDFPRWMPLWDSYNAFYGRVGESALPSPITQMTWSRFLDPDEPVHAIVAETDGKLVGFVHYLFHRSTIHLAPTCYLQDLFTVEEARGKGIGSALINAVYEQAKSAGSRRVYWQTQENNVVAMQLYDKLAERSGFLVYRKEL